MSQFSDEGLRLVSFCPLCETHYHPGEARVLHQEGNSQLVHLTCPRCANSMIALLVAGQNGVSSVGLVTDLSFGDVIRFRGTGAVETDDVLEVHAALEDEAHFWRALT